MLTSIVLSQLAILRLQEVFFFNRLLLYSCFNGKDVIFSHITQIHTTTLMPD